MPLLNWKIVSSSVALSAAFLVFMLFYTQGLQPEGVCTFVPNETGLLPLNPNENGNTHYSCNPSFLSFGGAVFVLAISMHVVVCLGLWLKGFLKVES